MEKIDLKETLELMVKNEFSNLSVTSIENKIYVHGLKDKKYSSVRQFPRTSSFEEFINEICKKCSFKYPSNYPQDGKIIEIINSLEYSFLVILLSLDGGGSRIEFVRV